MIKGLVIPKEITANSTAFLGSASFGNIASTANAALVEEILFAF